MEKLDFNCIRQTKRGVTGEGVRKGKKKSLLTILTERFAGQILGSCTDVGLIVIGLPV